MKKKTFLSIGLLLFATSNLFAQYKSVTAASSPDGVKIVQIDFNKASTDILVSCRSTKAGLNTISDDVRIIDDKGAAYELQNVVNAAMNSEASPKGMLFKTDGVEHQFVLQFPAVPKGKFDIVDDGKGSISLKFIDVVADTKTPSEPINITKLQNTFQYTETGEIIQDGHRVTYYRTPKFRLMANLYENKLYGRYYTVDVTIENLSNKSMLFNMDNVSVDAEKVNKKGVAEKVSLEILTAEQYDKRIANRQVWTKLDNEMTELSAAKDAGRKEVVTNSKERTNAEVKDKTGKTAVKAENKGTERTEVRDGAAEYAARQQAEANIKAFNAELAQKRADLKDAYLKTNPIEPGMTYTGYFNMPYKRTAKIDVVFNMAGENFLFHF